MIICIIPIPKVSFTPPILICVNLLVLFVRQTWNSNNAILVGKASFLLPSSCCRLPFVSSDLLCPLLSYSLSSVSLRDFFGVAHLITIAGQATSSYRNVLLLFFLVMPKLERARFYAWLIESVIIRCTCCSCCFPSSSGSIETTQTTLTLFFSDEPFSHFSCDRFLIVCPWFFFSTCDFVKKVPSNRGEALILMYHFRSQFCGLKTGK